MAGIYIPSMEMPNTCYDCPFQIDECFGSIKCRFAKTWGSYSSRAADCPLVPVPDHGRLVDVDEVCNRLLTLWDTADKEKKVLISAVLADVVTPIIVGTPTIISASDDTKTEEDTEPWLCLSCRHYPPSSTDGKPCSQCNPSEVWHSCYDPAEEGEA